MEIPVLSWNNPFNGLSFTLCNSVFLFTNCLHKSSALWCVLIYETSSSLYFMCIFFLPCYSPWQMLVLIFDPCKGCSAKDNPQIVAWDRWWGPVYALENSDYISRAFSCNSCVPLIKTLRNSSPHVLLSTKTAKTLFSWIKEMQFPHKFSYVVNTYTCRAAAEMQDDMGQTERRPLQGREGTWGGCFPTCLLYHPYL